MPRAPAGQAPSMLKTVLLALVLVLVPGPAASAQDAIGEAATALAEDPVYVAPEAQATVSDADADRLRARIRERGGGPLYIAVLPASAADEGGGSARGVAQELHRQLGRPGTYAVVAGKSFAAGSTDVSGMGAQATAAFEAHRSEGVAAVLLDF